MSIKHVLLALLNAEPTHGYELKRQFDETVGKLWSVQQAQIYNNLRLLEKDALIELEARIEQENLPDRKTYRLTAAGGAELSTWLATPVQTSRQLKDDFYLKLATLATVLNQPETLSALIWRQREVYLLHLRELERALAQAEAEEDAVTASLLDGAILHAEADLAWLDRCETRLLAPGGTP
jgi:DNA-binding PadR family transcriptional regulator